MRKFAISIKSNRTIKACHVFIPEKFADDLGNEQLIRSELGKAFGNMGFNVLSIQRVVECGIELAAAA